MQCVLTCMGKFAKQRVADGAAPAKTGKKVKKGCAPTAKAKGILKTSPSTRDHGIEIGNALDKLAQNYFSSKEEEQKPGRLHEAKCLKHCLDNRGAPGTANTNVSRHKLLLRRVNCQNG